MKKIKITFLFLALLTLFIGSCDEPPKPVRLFEAKAGPDQSIDLGEEAHLDGTGSKPATIEFDFQWEIVQKPAGSLLEIEENEMAEMDLHPDQVGDYLIKLTVRFEDQQDMDTLKLTVSQGTHPVTISQNITQNRVLEDIFPNQPGLLDYIVNEDIAVEALLDVRQGVRIGFEEGVKLTIKPTGALKAISGAVERPIIFQGKVAGKGYWQGILLESASENNSFQDVHIKDAGKAPFGVALMLGPNAKVKVTRSLISQNAGLGMEFLPGSSFFEFAQNKIEDNSEGPLRIPAKLIPDLWATNSIEGENIQVVETQIQDGLEHIWPVFDAQYHVLGDLIISRNTRLILSGGTVVNMAPDKMIRVTDESMINLLGEADLPVKIEGYVKSKGSWKGIFIDDSGTDSNQILFTEIHHAGSTPMAGQESATLQIGRKGKLSIAMSKLNLGKGNGLEAVANEIELTFQLNTISNHDGHPMVVATDQVENLDFRTIMENNGKPEIKVDGLIPISKSSETIWEGFSNQSAYLIDGLGKDLTVRSGLHLKEGVTIKFRPGATFLVHDAQGSEGYLKVSGSTEKPVTIQGKEETAGSWYGITISTDHTENLIENAVILHGGKPMQNNFSANLTIDNSPEGKVVIRNTTIGKSGQHGIAIAKQIESNLVHQGLTFVDNPGAGLHIWGL